MVTAVGCFLVSLRGPVLWGSGGWGGRTFFSMNLLIVASMSWWPETSSSVVGLYFSTLWYLLIAF